MSHTAPSYDEAGTEPGDGPATGSDADVLDEEWLAAPRQRSRFRLGLGVALVALLVFLGGVEVQKRWGSLDAASTAGRPSSGSFPAGGAFPSAFGGSAVAGGSSTASQGSSQAQADGGSGSTTPAVIGKLVGIHGDTWTVKDLGGTSHPVTVTGRTTVTRSAAEATDPIRTGSSVTVLGTAHGDKVAATAITLR